MTLNLWLAIVAGVVFGFLGWMLGRGAGRAQLVAALRRYAADVSSGAPARSDAPEVVELDRAIRTHWTPRGTEFREAASRALDRVTAYLHHNVERPLALAAGGPPAVLKDGVEEALGALADLEFFAAVPSADVETLDLGRVVAEVAAEYKDDSGADVRFQETGRAVRVLGNGERLKDALFLVLHNAGHFGAGEPVELRMGEHDGNGRVIVADRGPGFTAEALSRAYDPFYTTVPSGLGLGLTHARRLVEAMGGGIHLRNRDGGGAEVEIGLPSA